MFHSFADISWLTDMNERKRVCLCLVLVLLAGFIAQSPLAAVMQFHHPDERYYTDAALLMVESGDYGTPRFYDGTLRPHKPLLAYWLIAGSFRLFGISMLSARLPSLLSGALLLVLTYRLGWTATRRRETALLAACLTASQYTFVLCSNRATPDIFLTTALVLGFLGLFRALQRGRADACALAAVFGGAGCAILAKGLLGLVFLLFAGGCLNQMDGARRPWRLLALVVSLIIVVGGYAFMVSSFDAEFVHGFLYDQVIGRFVKDNWWHKPLNTLGYLLLTPMLFIAWWPLLARRETRARLLALVRQPRERWVVAAGLWMLACAVIFGLGNKLTARYVFSAVPLLAVLLAEVIARPAAAGSDAAVVRRLPRGLKAAATGLLLLGVATVPLTGGLAQTQALPTAALAGTLALTLAVARLAPPGLAAPAGWSLLSLAGLPLIALTMHISFNQGIEQQLPGVIAHLQSQPALRDPVICSIHPAALSRARLVAGRALPLVPARDAGTNAIPAAVRARLISALDTTTPHSVEFVTVSSVPLPVGSSKEIIQAWRARQLPLWRWLPSLLRDGFPVVEFRIEARRNAAGAPD